MVTHTRYESSTTASDTPLVTLFTRFPIHPLPFPHPPCHAMAMSDISTAALTTLNAKTPVTCNAQKVQSVVRFICSLPLAAACRVPATPERRSIERSRALPTPRKPLPSPPRLPSRTPGSSPASFEYLFGSRDMTRRVECLDSAAVSWGEDRGVPVRLPGRAVRYDRDV
jgi:hypothetical protein